MLKKLNMMNGKDKSEPEFILLKLILLKPLLLLKIHFILTKLIMNKLFKKTKTLLSIPIKKEIPLQPIEKLLMLLTLLGLKKLPVLLKLLIGVFNY